MIETYDLDNMTLDELILLEKKIETEYNNWDSTNNAYKILINAFYGSQANSSSRWFDNENAEAITSCGQLCIIGSSKYISDLAVIIYNDTDSWSDTLVNLVGGDKKLTSDIYDNHTYNKIEYKPNKYMADCDLQIPTLNTDTNEIETSRIKHVFKHKIKKRMFKINYDDKEIIITEDHSIMVFRNGEIIEIKPSDILKDDKLVKISIDMKYELITEYTITDLGIIEDDVYDIETVSMNHNLFVNDLLVHNSIYYSLKNYEPLPTWQENLEYLLNIDKEIVSPKIKQFYNILADYFNVKNRIKHDIELIGDNGVFLEKKKYFLRKIWDDGSIHAPEEYKIKSKGIDIARNDTPQFVKNHLKKILEFIIDNKESELYHYIDEVKKEYYKQPITVIGKPTGVNIKEDHKLGGKKPLPIHVRASLNYNNWIKKNKFEEVYPTIFDGNKIKYCYVVKDKTSTLDNVIAITDDIVPKELIITIDYDTMFEKGVSNVVNRFVKILNWSEDVNNNLDDLFN